MGADDTRRRERLVWLSERVGEEWATRDDRGFAITMDWGEPTGWVYDPLGMALAVWCPTFTVHYDQPLEPYAALVAAAQALLDDHDQLGIWRMPRRFRALRAALDGAPE